MKTTISLPVPPEASVVVSIGDHVHPGSILAKGGSQSLSSSIPLAQLLNIKPSHITKYLKKRVDEPVNTGDVIACKRTFFSSSLIRSPQDGQIREIDIIAGTIRIGDAPQNDHASLLSPVKGIVKEINDAVTLEISGIAYTGSQGAGSMAYGSILPLSGDTIDMFQIQDTVEDSIVVGNSFMDDTIMKLDALGASGIISEKEVPINVLPWVRVGHDTHQKLVHHAKEVAIIIPEQSNIFVVREA